MTLQFLILTNVLFLFVTNLDFCLTMLALALWNKWHSCGGSQTHPQQSQAKPNRVKTGMLDGTNFTKIKKGNRWKEINIVKYQKCRKYLFKNIWSIGYFQVMVKLHCGDQLFWWQIYYKHSAFDTGLCPLLPTTLPLHRTWIFQLVGPLHISLSITSLFKGSIIINQGMFPQLA